MFQGTRGFAILDWQFAIGGAGTGVSPGVDPLSSILHPSSGELAGGPTREWDRVHELAVEVANASMQDDAVLSEAKTQEMIYYLRELPGESSLALNWNKHASR